MSASGALTFAYDADRARVRQTLGQAGVSDFTTCHVGNYEENQSEIVANGATPAGTLYEQRHYLNIPEGPVGLVIFHSRDNGLVLPSGLSPVDHRYWHKDHLGSIAVITDGANQVKQKFAFDPVAITAWPSWRMRATLQARSSLAINSENSRCL